MKLTVLVDNNTYIDQYYWGEPALCLYIEDGDRRILFDTGYSEIFMHNAARLSALLFRTAAEQPPRTRPEPVFCAPTVMLTSTGATSAMS